MVGVLEPPRVACVASGPKASNHQVMKPASRNCRLPWSVRSTSRIQSLFRSQIGLDANRPIHRLSERTEGKSFLDIPSHRTHRQYARAMEAGWGPTKTWRFLLANTKLRPLSVANMGSCRNGLLFIRLGLRAAIFGQRPAINRVFLQPLS